jgi:two-component system sensor histidine kinase UhpB
MAEEQVNAGKADQVENSLNTIQQSANDMVNRLNDLVWAINPEYNSVKNLMQKLEEYAMEMAMAKNIKVKVNSTETWNAIQLPVESHHNIYLLGKEAINNAVKYSHASLLELNVHNYDHIIEFAIKDNGKGFDPTKVKKGNGLLNMHKRAEDAAAILSVKSTVSEGTVISLKCKIT